MKVIYIPVGTVDYETTRLFGAYDTEGAAKERLREVKDDESIYCDQYYLHELILNQPTDDMI